MIRHRFLIVPGMCLSLLFSSGCTNLWKNKKPQPTQFPQSPPIAQSQVGQQIPTQPPSWNQPPARLKQSMTREAIPNQQFRHVQSDRSTQVHPVSYQPSGPQPANVSVTPVHSHSGQPQPVQPPSAPRTISLMHGMRPTQTTPAPKDTVSGRTRSVLQPTVTTPSQQLPVIENRSVYPKRVMPSVAPTPGPVPTAPTTVVPQPSTVPTAPTTIVPQPSAVPTVPTTVVPQPPSSAAGPKRIVQTDENGVITVKTANSNQLMTPPMPPVPSPQPPQPPRMLPGDIDIPPPPAPSGF